jgi:tetratricopeptide (TPR) repeat protein
VKTAILRIARNLSFDQSLMLYRSLFRQGEKYGYEYELIHQLLADAGIEFPESFVKVGYRLWQQRDLEPAEKNLLQALELADRFEGRFLEDEVEAHFWLGRLYYRRGEVALAADHFRSVVQLDPDNRELWYTHPAYLFIGDIDMEEGDCGQAAQNFLKAYETAAGSNQNEQAVKKCEMLIESNACNSVDLEPCMTLKSK